MINSDGDVFSFIGLFITSVVNFAFYLIAFVVFLVLALRAKRRFQQDLLEQSRKQYKGFRIAAFVSGGVTLLMAVIGVVALVLAKVLFEAE